VTADDGVEFVVAELGLRPGLGVAVLGGHDFSIWFDRERSSLSIASLVGK
jgi:nitrate reductase NapE component